MTKTAIQPVLLCKDCTHFRSTGYVKRSAGGLVVGSNICMVESVTDLIGGQQLGRYAEIMRAEKAGPNPNQGKCGPEGKLYKARG